jgi:O-antigen/teichoic acid export membrane protein
MLRRQEPYKQVLSSFSATTLAIILSLGTSVLLARTLGPEGRGLLLALTFWPALFAALLNLSLNESTAYHIAKRVGTPDFRTAVSASGHLVILTAIVATCTALIALYFAVPEQYRGYLGLVMLYTLTFIPLSHGEQWLRGILQGRGAILSLSALRLIQPIIYFGILFALSVQGLLDVSSAMVVGVIAIFMSLVVGVVVVRPSMLVAKSGLNWEIASTGWRFHKANLLLYSASELDKLIVLFLLTTTQAGLFAVAIAVSSIGTGVVLQSLGLMLMRDMAEASDGKSRRSIFIVNIRAAIGVLLVGNGVAAVLAPWAVPLLFGASFAAAVPVTVLLLGMGALKGARQMIDKTLRANHHTRTGMIGEAVAFGGLAILGSIGAVAGGLEGLALGALIAQAAALIVVIRFACAQFDAGPLELWPFQRATLDDVRDFLRPSLRLGEP